MSYHGPFVLSFLIALLLTDFVTTTVHWDEMWVKHTWNAVPANWESLGDPPAGAIIDLHMALKPNRERALIKALSEVSNPRHPRHVHLTTPSLTALFDLRCSLSDMVYIFLRNRFPSLSVRPQTRSTLFMPGLYTVAYDPPPSQRRTAAPG